MKTSEQLINISTMKPWWLRLLLLIFIGLPVISKWPLEHFINTTDPFSQIFLWISYGIFIWLFIILNCGIERLLSYLSIASIVGLTTTISGAIMRKLMPFISGKASDLEINLHLVLLFVEIITVVPFALFFVNSFSVTSVLMKMNQKEKSYKNKLAYHTALVLRVFQHVGEVLINLLCVWREENPKVLIPRFHKKFKSLSLKSIFTYISWFFRSMIIWSFAIFIFTINAVPVFVDEISKYINKNR